MKIWFPTIKAGSGADIYTERLVKSLKEKGIDSEITWFNKYFELFPPLLRMKNIPENVDIIHTNSRYGFPFKNLSSKLVITLHSCMHDPKCKAYKSKLQALYHDMLIKHYEKMSIEAADKIVAVSNYVSHTSETIFQSHELTTIHNGIDEKLFSPTKKNYKNKKFKLLFVGNTKKLKGFELLSLIMRQLGDGFTLNYTGERRESKNRTPHNMINIGKLDTNSLLQAYQECDVFLFPSRHEGFGYAICEAMACGKPVIVSDNSAMMEVVKNNETGIICKTDDVDDFCRAIKLLSDNIEYRIKLGKAARNSVLNNFTLNTMVEKYIKLYESIF